ncbi:nuclease-related domain-containing protein [Lysinibacillus piscis]|uniref:Nuclease n=1 Tax=Lysinibacillus piscis TaxID=2518931 RepID=A0ABQ5NKC4_9BACI|nr:NERD domain-containing protein [Lysinibacillus sp. KH24]GLC88811.1 nuclease [Lysinibacillus sp. KH24]
MILLARQPSETKKMLEALLYRLPATHRDYMYYEEQLRRIQAGFAGEQRVDAEWLEIDLPFPHYFLHDLQVTNRFGTSHQIDTILLCPHFILLLEIKNIAGMLKLDKEFAQFTRTTIDGQLDGMTNPFYQVRRHQEWLTWELQQVHMTIPVHHAVVMATKKAILSNGLSDQAIFHVAGLRYYVRKLLQQYPNVMLDEKELAQLAQQLLAKHRPFQRKLSLPLQDIQKGVLCPQCSNGQQMDYHYKKWVCRRCGLIDANALLRTLEDYRLLMGEMLTNQSFCTFFAIDSPNIAYKLLKKLPLQAVGEKRHRQYWIMEPT